MRILVTGASGFVGLHFLQYLQSISFNEEVIAIYNHTPPNKKYQFPTKTIWIKANLLEGKAIYQIISKHQPTHILHLAAQSSVAKSWQQPHETILQNSNQVLQLIQAVQKNNPAIKLVLCGSAEVYAPTTEILTEKSELAATNPYAFSKKMQEQLSEYFTIQHGLSICCTRAFNHIGPGQNTQFVIASFIEQLAQQKNAGSKNLQLQVGNTEAIRDFTDVRDVVRAYWLILQSTTITTYNICSGIPMSILQMIQQMEQVVQQPISLTENPERMRPADNPIILGSSALLQKELVWLPNYTLSQTLQDIFATHSGK